MIKYFIFIFSFLFSSNANILTINDKAFSLHDFFARYPKKQWERADSLQKEKMFNDFINRELCVLEAQNIGLHNDPENVIKIYNRSNQILVNESYEHFVARPLVSKAAIDLTRKNAKKEVYVSHILIGHSNSYLNSPPKRSVDEALLFSQKIKKEFESGNDFAVLAEKYSDDYSSKNNSGIVGWVTWGATVPEFQEAAFSQKKGVISSPVLTNFGYHLILVTDERVSDYQYMNDAAYENLVFNIAKNSIRDKLRPAATKYDEQILEEFNVVFNIDAINEIVDIYNNNIALENNTSLDVFNSLFNSVVCIYNNKGFGIKWFLNKLSKFPSSRTPKLNDKDNILSVFQTIILQDIAIIKGLESNVDQSYLYKWKVNDMVSNLLYDSYLKYLVNSVDNPDSLVIKEYYEKNKLKDYMTDETVTIREIKVLNKDLADSLYNEALLGSNFFELANSFSLTSPDKGGLMGPFSKKQSSKYFDISSNLKIDEISTVFSSTNSSFSIIKLINKNPGKPLPFLDVYKKIELLLLKEIQEKNKITKLASLKNKNKIIKNTSLLYNK